MQNFLVLMLLISVVLQAFTQADTLQTSPNHVCPPCSCSCSGDVEGVTANGNAMPKSCRDVTLGSAKSLNQTGGVFDINVPKVGVTEVYCDMKTDGGKWTVFQRRMNGSVEFNRYWCGYANGFGNTRGEFWLGLETIHQLTKAGTHELRFDMIAKDGTQYYAKYSSFKVGSASNSYQLSVSGYSGNATDSFAKPPNPKFVLNGMKFSTRDRDNDLLSDEKCATLGGGGGWWLNSCGQSSLNIGYNTLIWYINQKIKFMKFTEMKLRQKP